MKRTLILAAATLLLGVSPALADTGSWWFHLLVQERSEDGDRVRINLPAKVVEASYPLLRRENFRDGGVWIHHHKYDESDLRALLAAARGAEDGEYISVRDPDAEVHVSKSGDQMTIVVRRRQVRNKDVTIRLPIEILDALLSGSPNKLNVEAAVHVLGSTIRGQAVTIDDEDSSVRIWVDDKSTTD